MSAKPCNRNAEESFPVLSLKSREQKPPNPLLIQDKNVLQPRYDPYAGLAVTVKRVSDSKRFVLPLANLKATEKPSNNAQLLDDYVVWFVNGRR